MQLKTLRELWPGYGNISSWQGLLVFFSEVQLVDKIYILHIIFIYYLIWYYTAASGKGREGYIYIVSEKEYET